MARPPDHSIPPSQPAPFRHLGTGSGGRGDRPMRVQLIVALVAGLILVAVPLYLWRRPRAAKADPVDAGTEAAAQEAGPPPDAASSLAAAAMDGSVSTGDLTVDKPRIVRCQRPGPGKTPPEQCDHQPFFEEALVKAVLENVSCAPKLPKGGTVSFALKVDYKKKSVHLFAGKSGSIRHKRAGALIECVQRAIATPNWESLSHQYSVYTIALQASYPPAEKPSDKADKGER